MIRNRLAGCPTDRGLKTGWVIGAGAQWVVDRRWSVKAEYLYTDFGSVTVAVPVANTPDFTQRYSPAAM